MKPTSKPYCIVFALMIGIFASFSSFAEDATAGKPIVVVRSFDVGGDQAGFVELATNMIQTAQKKLPKQAGVARILAGNIGGQSAHMITIYTTYANLDDYATARAVIDKMPEIKEFRVNMDKAGYKVLHSSVNTLVAEFD